MKLNEFQVFTKNFIFIIISLVVSSLIKILITRHISFVFQSDGYGTLNFIEKYSTYFILFSSIGIDIVAIRLMSINKADIKSIYSSLVPLKIILSLIFFCLMLIPMLFIDKLMNSRYLLIFFSSVILTTPFTVQPIFDSIKRQEIPSIIEILLILINYILIRIFIVHQNDIIYAAIIIFSLSFIRFTAHQIIFAKLFGIWRPKIDLNLWKRLFTSGIVIGFIQITIYFIHYFNVFIIGLMKDDTSIGQFSASYHAMFMIIQLMGIFHTLMIPILFGYFRTSRLLYEIYFNKYMKFMIFLGYSVTIIFYFLATEYLSIFYDLKEFNQSIMCFKILILSQFFMTINSPLHSGLLSANKEKTLLKITGFQLIVNIVSNVILIKKFGINGSAAASVITEAIGLPLYIFIFNKIIPVKHFKHFIIASLSIIPMALFLYYSTINFIPRAIISILIVIISSILLRGYTIREILEIKTNLFSIKRNSIE
jgi:O-antigen/teichoic acid export membrane protein